ncbi:MAG: hypothetical protein RR885_03345, partial [Oscillospiraceae bacterium]
TICVFYPTFSFCEILIERQRTLALSRLFDKGECADLSLAFIFILKESVGELPQPRRGRVVGGRKRCFGSAL